LEVDELQMKHLCDGIADNGEVAPSTRSINM
jgi:hypothetical protein